MQLRSKDGNWFAILVESRVASERDLGGHIFLLAAETESLEQINKNHSHRNAHKAQNKAFSCDFRDFLRLQK
jgi:hypothetical protein